MVMNDSTQNKRVWKRIIGAPWKAPERAFYELSTKTGRKKNHRLPLSSARRLPGRGGWPFWDIPGKGGTKENA